MFAQLPDVEETPWGKQLKERWTNEGRAEGRLHGQIERLEKQLQTLEQIFEEGELPEAAYTRLRDETQTELQAARAELARLSNGTDAGTT